MTVITGLSGNEIFCLRRQQLTPGDLVIGNSVIALGLVNSLASGLKTLVGGEVTPVTAMIHEGRQRAYARMYAEANHHGGWGITGVTNELIFHGTNIEFLAIGSCVHRDGAKAPQKSSQLEFSTAADGQSLYCQIDSGFTPRQFVLVMSLTRSGWAADWLAVSRVWRAVKSKNFRIFLIKRGIWP
jgi:uncharacterized protein YbjQ (UPF0145 family)